MGHLGAQRLLLYIFFKFVQIYQPQILTAIFPHFCASSSVGGPKVVTIKFRWGFEKCCTALRAPMGHCWRAYKLKWLQ